MTAFYNEIDPKAAAWLRELIQGGLVANGVVDERSIAEISPEELEPYNQVHFFAGIGAWSHALRLAGITEQHRVWTGSPPCQGFSVAGKRKGFADERHLWPEMFRLIKACKPPLVYGEQVSNVLAWADLVNGDLTGVGYNVEFREIPNCAIGAPHIRQRLWFAAELRNA